MQKIRVLADQSCYPIARTMLTLHAPAPAFSLSDQDGVMRSLVDYAGKWILLYFYPEDDTPGCTKEACGFRDLWTELSKRDCVVLGVSPDSPESHAKFAKKYRLPFSLLSDRGKKMLVEYGAWREKKFLGKRYMGTARISYFIDPDGNVAKMYDKVKPEEHPEEVLRDLEILRNDKAVGN